MMQPQPHLEPDPKEGAASSDIRGHAQEVFDLGIYAALELCRQGRMAGEDFKPFEAFERRIILLALKDTEGNQLRAARLLGINRSTLRKRMKKHGIRVGTRVI